MITHNQFVTSNCRPIGPAFGNVERLRSRFMEALLRCAYVVSDINRRECHPSLAVDSKAHDRPFCRALALITLTNSSAIIFSISGAENRARGFFPSELIQYLIWRSEGENAGGQYVARQGWRGAGRSFYWDDEGARLQQPR